MNVKFLTTTLTLFAAAVSASAAVTVQAWYHLGDVADYYADSSGNNRRIGAAYSHVPPNNPAYGGNFSGIITAQSIGGPLGSSGFTSQRSLRSGAFGTMICTMWGAAGYNPPPTNYFIEIWAQPSGKGYVGGACWIFTSGSSGGYALRVIDSGDGTTSFAGSIIGGPDVGNPVPIDTNRWTHLAMVNVDGVTTFYVNGVASGDGNAGGATAPAGDIYFGNPGSWQGFDGLIDEARICTFEPGTFSTSDFLIPPVGPNILVQPQSAGVWDGGAVPFTVEAVLNPDLTYQWQRNGSDIAGETQATLFFPQVALADSGSQFRCVLTAGGLSVTSAVATLTVLPQRTADNAFYREAVTSEPFLLAYYPVDDCNGPIVTNILDDIYSGVWQTNALYDGRTNRAYGQRAMAFNLDNSVQIPNNAGYEFGVGEGTIEAVVYMSQTTLDNPTIFAWAYDNSTIGYAIQVSRDGALLIYTNSSPVVLTWPAPVNLVGRVAHLAVTIEGGTQVTAYLDGQSLGTKTQPGFGPVSGAPFWIGARGTGTANRWAGTIDELAIYESALSLNTLQVHYSRYVYGTNVSAPSIVSQPGARTLLAGSSPILPIKAAGTLPISYQWTFKGAAIPGANSATLYLQNTTSDSSGDYVLYMTNALGWAKSEPIALTFVPATSRYAAALLQDGPSSYWRLGETSGTRAVDSAGFNDATYVGALTLGAPGAIPADGDSAVSFANGHADVPYTPALNPSTPFSVEFWAKPTQSGQIQRCVIGSQNRNVGRSGYAIYQGLNGNFWEVHMGDGSTVQIWMFGKSPVVAGLWYHVALVYLPGDPTYPARLYVNGVDDTDYVNSYTTSGGNFLPNNSAPFEIASRFGGGVPFPGIVDEVAFYNYAVSGEQLQKHYDVGNPPYVTITPAGNILPDTKAAGARHHGLNQGAAWAASDNDSARTRSGVMQFNATEGDQITVPASPEFNGEFGTISFWMRSAGTTGAGTEGAILFDRRTDTGLVIVQLDDGRISIQTAPASINSFASVATVNDDRWHHVAVTYELAEFGVVSLYIDGVLDTASANLAVLSWPASQRIELGRSHDTYWKQFNGLLDDVWIYNRALDENQIKQLYAGTALEDLGMVARLDFGTAPQAGYLVSWFNGGLLQSATQVTGPFSDVPVSASPLPVIPSGKMEIFRSRK